MRLPDRDSLIGVIEAGLEIRGINKGFDLKFLGEAALVLRFHLRKKSNGDALGRVVSKIDTALRSEGHLQEIGSYYSTQAVIFPYVCLSGFVEPHGVLDSLVKLFRDSHSPKMYREPFREKEDSYISYMAGHGSLPRLEEGSIKQDCERIYDFSVHDLYVITHIYIYATDLNDIGRERSWFTVVLLFIVVRAVEAKNVDLFLEAGFCLCNESVSRKDIGVLSYYLNLISQDYADTVSKGDLTDYYHEMLVGSLFSEAMSTYPVEERMPDVEAAVALSHFAISLRNKSADDISSSYRSLRNHYNDEFFKILAIRKLKDLQELTAAEVLFAKEISILGGGTIGEVYTEYSKTLLKVLEEVRRS